MLAKFLRILDYPHGDISLGAIIGAMVTMYSAVSNRTARSARCGRWLSKRSIWRRSHRILLLASWRLAGLFALISTIDNDIDPELSDVCRAFFRFSLTWQIVYEPWPFP